jgi:hypothetical protein
MTQQKNKQGDRQRTPRSPWGLPPKRPPQNPPLPSKEPSRKLQNLALTAATLTVGLPRNNPVLAMLLLRSRR